MRIYLDPSFTGVYVVDAFNHIWSISLSDYVMNYFRVGGIGAGIVLRALQDEGVMLYG
jgi:hypothetical protein